MIRSRHSEMVSRYGTHTNPFSLEKPLKLWLRSSRHSDSHSACTISARSARALAAIMTCAVPLNGIGQFTKQAELFRFARIRRVADAATVALQQ
jgi:hypothetical protein